MFQKLKKKSIYLLVLLIPFIFLFFKQDIFVGLKMKVVEVSSWPAKIALFPIREAKKILFYRSTYNQYQSLKEEVETLRHRLMEQEEILQENSRFKKLLDFQKSFVFSSTAANVIGRDPSNWGAAIIIDRGTEDNLKSGMAVVSASGVVGNIVEVGKETSKVMLLTDPRFAVAAIVQRNREQGLVTGTLQGVCRMEYLSSQASVEVGDKVITSSLSSFFPEGLMIGKVIEVRESLSSPTLECLVEPAVSLSQVEEVLVIRTQP